MTAIHLGRLLPDASRNQPGQLAWKPAWALRPALPLFGLAPGGVYHAARVAEGAVGSYPTLSPLPCDKYRYLDRAVCFLWHFP
ncbi:hypothetical protein GCM10011316_05940 [Roseibium aquae]|uniref:Uncharacterized protein n=1 Tax=Roseibium aquae TaxID=1323746 RepID=A0A916WX37_9HYPH|nr:hypothetical protein GCM10011316_05940 [Roseibium aquae]